MQDIDIYKTPVNPELIQDVESAYSGIDIESIEKLRPHAEILDLQKALEEARSEATSANLPKSSIRVRIGEVVTLRPPQPLENRLIEQEAIIGGSVIPLENVKFFYLHGYWYLVMHDEKGTVVASYHFTEDQAYKIVNGKHVPFVKVEADYFDEKENVMTAIPLAVKKVMSEMYNKDISERTEESSESSKEDFPMAA